MAQALSRRGHAVGRGQARRRGRPGQVHALDQSNLTQVEGPNILRCKGIVAFKDEPKRFVFQGVHMILDGDLQRDWKPGEKRESSRLHRPRPERGGDPRGLPRLRGLRSVIGRSPMPRRDCRPRPDLHDRRHRPILPQAVAPLEPARMSPRVGWLKGAAGARPWRRRRAAGEGRARSTASRRIRTRGLLVGVERRRALRHRRRRRPGGA